MTEAVFGVFVFSLVRHATLLFVLSFFLSRVTRQCACQAILFRVFTNLIADGPDPPYRGYATWP
jgi:hypothetical protein